MLPENGKKNVAMQLMANVILALVLLLIGYIINELHDGEHERKDTIRAVVLNSERIARVEEQNKEILRRLDNIEVSIKAIDK